MGKNKIRLIAAALLLVWHWPSWRPFLRSAAASGGCRGALRSGARPLLESGADGPRPSRRYPGGEVRKFSGDEAEAAAAAARSLEYGGVERKGGIRTEAGDYRVFIDTAGGPVWLFVRADGPRGAWTVRGASPSVWRGRGSSTA